jgi:acyl-CoA thioesterase-2
MMSRNGGVEAMSRVLEELLELLDLEMIEEGIFRGQSQDLGWGTVYGGQALGQGLSAAAQTVDRSRPAHSFHAYFLRRGDPRRPIVYHVESTRDGASFSTRRVKAVQHGRPIFFMAASFQHHGDGLDHQVEAPEVAAPEDLPTLEERIERFREQIPEQLRAHIAMDLPIEMRPVDVSNPVAPEPRKPLQHMWLRAKGSLPDRPATHRQLLAYASDFSMLDTVLMPHGRSYWQGELRMASIDHAMWFHRDFRFDDWVLYAIDSPSASGDRGFARGQIFDRSGRLVASTTQEGMIRQVGPR